MHDSEGTQEPGGSDEVDAARDALHARGAAWSGGAPGEASPTRNPRPAAPAGAGEHPTEG